MEMNKATDHHQSYEDDIFNKRTIGKNRLEFDKNI